MSIRSFTLDLDDASYRAALERAAQAGKTIEDLMAEFLANYAGEEEGSAPATTYTVQRGDTLTKIARRVYGDAYKYPLIQRANKIDDAGRIWVGQVLVIPAISGGSPAPSEPLPQPTPQPEPPAPAPTPQIDPCEPIPNVSYKTISINGSPTDRPAPVHGDLNLALRSYAPTNAPRNLISMGGATDANAPQLRGLFGDKRLPDFPSVYRVHDWDWSQGAQGGRGALLSKYEVTMLGMSTTPGEIIYVPNAGYSIGEGMQVLLLYATSERVTIKYTREDNVVDGYTLHIEGICVDPQLQQVYDELDRAGRRNLLALAAGQPLGRALGAEIAVAVRDKGTFMDPRTSKDWWR